RYLVRLPASAALLFALAACARARPVTFTEGFVPLSGGLRLYYRTVGEGPDTAIVGYSTPPPMWSATSGV
ncbi:MAG: hypothetical protein ACREMO_06605, partial [Gemmatimonadales bacterium]